MVPIFYKLPSPTLYFFIFLLSFVVKISILIVKLPYYTHIMTEESNLLNLYNRLFPLSYYHSYQQNLRFDNHTLAFNQASLSFTSDQGNLIII